MLAKISIGWVWLDRTLNAMINAINQQKPIAGTSIAIEESPNGTVIKYTGAQQSDQPGGAGGSGGPTGGGWQQLTVIKVVNNQCTQQYLWYWGTGPTDNPTGPPS